MIVTYTPCVDNPPARWTQPECDVIGTMGEDGYVGGNITGAVRLDGSRRFYGCIEDIWLH